MSSKNHSDIAQSPQILQSPQGHLPQSRLAKCATNPTRPNAYKPKSLARRLIVAIFALIFIVQVLSIVISAVFLHQSHKDEMFENVENYANDLTKSLGTLDLHYRISVIVANGKVIFDNKIPINTLDNHLHREEVQNLMQGKSPKVARLSESEAKENLHFTRFIKLDAKADEPQKWILRISTDRDSLLFVLKNFAPLFGTLIIFGAVFSVILGFLLARKILNPIKTIDLSHPIKTNPYAELHIFMQRISKQKKKIKKQLKSIKQSKLRFEMIAKI